MDRSKTTSPAIFYPFRALRLSIRGLTRSPGTATAAILTLGIGLGATVALLGIIHGMFRPLPVPEGDRIVRMEFRDAQARPVAVTPTLLRSFSGVETGGLSALGAYGPFEATLDADEGFPERVAAAAMTPEVFEVLGIPPLRGSLPTRTGSDRNGVILGYRLWMDRFGGEPDVIGTTLRIDGVPRPVVGVMPEGFGFPFRQDLWTTLAQEEPEAWAGVELVARLADGMSLEAAEESLRTRLARMATDPAGDPAFMGNPDRAPARLVVREFVGGRGESGEGMALAGLSVLVALLLLVAGANASTLLLVRATERSGTMALHAALGASRLQVASQSFAEAAWIAVCGGALGLVLGSAMLRWVESHLSIHWGYYWMRMEVQPAVLVWTFGIVLLTAVLAGTAPALRAMRADLKGVLGGKATGSLGSASGSLGRWFLGIQVALSTAGLVAAVFLGSGVRRSHGAVEGLPLDEVVVATVPLSEVMGTEQDVGEEAPSVDMGVVIEAFRQAVAGLGQISALSYGVPGFGSQTSALEVLGAASGEPLRAFSLAADPNLLEAYGLQVLRGRGIRAEDGPEAPPVAVVNESFARRFFPGADPLEAQIRLSAFHAPGDYARIVGIVQDHLPDQPGLRGDRVYLALPQVSPGNLWISVRGGGPPGQVGPALRLAAQSAHPSLPVEDVRTLRDLMDYLSRIPRAIGLFGLAGGLVGVVVAAIGLFGLVAYQVRVRFPELGVRMAVGATGGTILREVVGLGIRRTIPGLVVGLGLGALVSPVLAAFLFGISPANLLVYLAVGAGMVSVAVLASLGPALRAARLDPLVVLRDE